MDMIAWVLVAVLAGLCIVLAKRCPQGSGRPKSDAAHIVRPLRVASGEEGSGARGPSVDEAGALALRGMSRYLRRAVLAPLEAGIRDGELQGPAQDATDALRDLCFHGEVMPEAASDGENVIAAIQEVTREYTLETGIQVKFSGPDRPVYGLLATERFKDALFLLLANADRLSGGRSVEVAVEDTEAGGDGLEGGGARDAGKVWIRVGDGGPGFTDEALIHGFEPFWTTDPDALGLGLTQAKALLEAQEAEIVVRNREQGGGEVIVSLRRRA